jgi:hypothetical protein
MSGIPKTVSFIEGEEDLQRMHELLQIADPGISSLHPHLTLIFAPFWFSL